jgi:integrase
MGRKVIAGLFKKGRTWHIDKYIGGIRVCKSTGTSDLQEAERYLIKLIDDARLAEIYGVRPKRSFNKAFAEYLIDKAHKRSLDDDKSLMRNLAPWIGELPIDTIHMGSMRLWIQSRIKQGVKTNTINMGLKLVRQVLNRAAVWKDSNNMTWLASPPKIELLKVTDQEPPYPLDWEEQERFFAILPEHLRLISLFAVNTGCRDQEICNLRWEWEIPVPQLNTSVFVIPKEFTKNNEDRLVVLNSIALDVVASCRGKHPTNVFSFRKRSITRIMSSGWKAAREKVNLSKLRVHDLKHTYGRRLRAADVSFEDRQDLLGHKSTRMTTHYSAAELSNLISASEKVVGGSDDGRPALVILRRRAV